MTRTRIEVQVDRPEEPAPLLWAPGADALEQVVPTEDDTAHRTGALLTDGPSPIIEGAYDLATMGAGYVFSRATGGLVGVAYLCPVCRRAHVIPVHVARAGPRAPGSLALLHPDRAVDEVTLRGVYRPPFCTAAVTVQSGILWLAEN